MYNKDMLIGILLSLGRTDVLIERVDNSSIGYRTRIRIAIRGNLEFLAAIERSLAQHEIKSRVYETESAGRPRPILRISGNINLFKLMALIPEYLPDSKGELEMFREVVNIVANKEHLTLDGFNRILEIRGMI
tara:strand:+ start:68 stop:466 length:399 start_codon:yes stop_codon:yes gene_type:complete